MPAQGINEVTFVARLGTETALRAQQRRDEGQRVVVAAGDVEESQVDDAGRVRRCDIRLSGPGGRKLASGEMKRPELAEGRDPRNTALVEDARRKALARGLPYYFTCNMAEVVLFSVASLPGQHDQEEKSFQLAPITHSREVEANMDGIRAQWRVFLDDLEGRLEAVTRVRPSVTNSDVIALRDAIYAIADEAIGRVMACLESDPAALDDVRDEVANTFGMAAALKPGFRAAFREELLQILRFGAFVAAQKLILYRVLEESGPRRSDPFKLDPITVPRSSTDPKAIESVLDAAAGQAISRSGDYETAFLPKPLSDLLFTDPKGAEEVAECRAGEVWADLAKRVADASWVSISRNLVGLLYEVIVAPEYRHELGQFYTREDVVDVLVTFAVRDAADRVLDPSTGGGSFVGAAYARKRALGDTHEDALADVWGCEITAFAAELTTISLATADASEPAAYPRVLLADFFDVKPGQATGLRIPGVPGTLKVPDWFDAVVGNPPYISYRRQTNQDKIVDCLASARQSLTFPKFSGKSDAYVWFLVHATQFLRDGGRLGFVVSSAVLFSDYGLPLIEFIGQHYRVAAVVDSMVERWFPDADTNTVLLMLEREFDATARENHEMRFVRLRRPLASLIAAPGDHGRRGELEDVVDAMLSAADGADDPRWVVNITRQGPWAGLSFTESSDDDTDGDAVGEGWLKDA